MTRHFVEVHITGYITVEDVPLGANGNPTASVQSIDDALINASNAARSLIPGINLTNFAVRTFIDGDVNAAANSF